MKRSLTIAATIIIMLCSVTVFGQIENIKMGKDSAISIDKIYVGILGINRFSVKSLETTQGMQFRIGAKATYAFNKMLSLRSYVVYQNEVNSEFTLNSFSLAFTPSSKFTLEVGKMATLSTQQRPHPVSGAGHFETWSEAQIPGGALGAKMTIAPVKDFSFGVGVAVREKQPEYHANVSFKKLTLSGYYGMHDKKAGAALSYTGKMVWSTLVWKQDNVVANMFGCTISQKHHISIYSDMGYDLKTNKLVRSEWGIYTSWQASKLTLLPGIGYNNDDKTIRGYLFIYL